MAKLLDNYIYDKSIKAYNELAERGKREHFKSLAGLTSLDPVVRELGKIRILQIGAASAVDVNYFPRNSLLTIVDPNPDFEEGVREELEKNPGPELQCYVITQGEDMRMVGDDTMDAVVTTMALSRAENAKNMLAEILRVLAPEGKYYFWEPVEFPELEEGNPFAPTSPIKSPVSPGAGGKNSPGSPRSPATAPERNPFIFQRQISTEMVMHSRTEVRDEHGGDHGALSNLKVLANVAFGRTGRRRSSLSVDDGAKDHVSKEERLIRTAGFAHVTCDNFLLDEPKEDELNKKTWLERKMSLSVPRHWHVKGIAEKAAAKQPEESAKE